MKIAWIILTFGILLAICSWFYFKPVESVNRSTYDHISVIVDGIALDAEIADTKAKQEKGLSGRKKIDSNEAMLFVFPDEHKYGFWMKDMNFPIDIIWLNHDLDIVTIRTNVSPDSFPEVFEATAPSSYVLETKAGFVKENGISSSSQVILIK